MVKAKYWAFGGSLDDTVSADFEEVACIDINKSLQEYVKKAAEDTNTEEATWNKNNYYAVYNICHYIKYDIVPYRFKKNPSANRG